MPGLSSVGISSTGTGGGGGSGRRGSAAFAPSDDGDAPSKPGILSRIGQIVTGIPGGLFQLGSDVARLPAFAAKSIGDGDFGERFPAVFGIGKGFQETGGRLTAGTVNSLAGTKLPTGGGSWSDYKDDPVGTLLNDVGNVATVASLGSAAPITGGLKVASVGAKASAAGSVTIASRVQQAAAASNKIADLPTAPYRFAITRGTEAAGRAASKRVEAGTGGAFAKGLVRFDPNAKAIQQVMLQGTARERTLSGLDPEEAGVLRQDIHRETAEAIANLPRSQRLMSVPQGKFGKDGLPLDEMLPVPEGFSLLSKAARGKLGEGEVASSTILPQHLADEVSRLTVEPSTLPGAKGVAQAMGPANRVHRMLRMDLNPGWMVGQAPGNAVMAGLQSPHPFRDIREYGRNILNKHEAADARITKTSGDVVREDVLLDQKVGSRTDRVLTEAERLVKKTHLSQGADRLDNASRTAFYDGRIKDGHTPEVAREMTLRSMGEFDKRNPVERAYLGRLAPFYGWNREIVKMTAHLAEDHPLRFAHMANIAAKNEAAQGELEPGERVVDGGFLVPFGQTGESFKGTAFGAGKKLGPVPKLAAILGTGDSMSTGSDLRAGQKFGESNSPGLHNLDEAGLSILRGYPTARAFTAAKGKDRYMTPAEGAVGFLTGLDLSHSPTSEEKAERSAKRKSKAQDAKIKRLTEATK